MTERSNLPLYMVAVLLVCAGFALGFLVGDASTKCAPENGGLMCIESKPDGPNERIWHP